MHRLLLLSCFVSSLVIYLTNAADIDLRRDYGEVNLEKRQNYTCSSAGLQEICQNNTAECISDMCASCSGYVLVAQCCALSTYSLMLQCFLNLYNNPAGITATVAPSSTKTADSSTITSSSNSTDSSLGGLGACVSLDSVLLACEDQTPGFSTEPFTARASCLCYSSGSYQPDLYDGMYSGCLAYLSTAEPSDYSSLTAGASGTLNLAPCNHVGTTVHSSQTSSTRYIGFSTPTSTTAGMSSSTAASSALSASTPTQSGTSNSGGSLIMDRRISFAWRFCLWAAACTFFGLG